MNNRQKRLDLIERKVCEATGRAYNEPAPRMWTSEPRYRDLPYFAYGSNLNLDQTQYRCKFAQNLGKATLNNYALTFRGVADIIPNKTRKVYGGLFRVTDRCLSALDRYEGWPYLYKRELVTVVDRDGDEVTAFVYVMNSAHERHALDMPSQYYFRSILKGFEDFDLHNRSLFEALADVENELSQAPTEVTGDDYDDDYNDYDYSQAWDF